jgi:hypothetical protein
MTMGSPPSLSFALHSWLTMATTLSLQPRIRLHADAQSVHSAPKFAQVTHNVSIAIIASPHIFEE